MVTIEFGLIVPGQAPPPAERESHLDALDQLLALAKVHYASAWSIDHLYGDILEGWTTVAHLSARHAGFQWGHTVLNQSFRNPALLARMAATL